MVRIFFLPYLGNRSKSDPCSYELFCLESHILSFPKVLQIPPESPCVSKISGSIRQVTRCHIAWNSAMHYYRCENIRCHFIRFTFNKGFHFCVTLTLGTHPAISTYTFTSKTKTGTNKKAGILLRMLIRRRGKFGCQIEISSLYKNVAWLLKQGTQNFKFRLYTIALCALFVLAFSVW